MKEEEKRYGKDDRNKSIELSTNIFNQNKEKVIMGTAKVKVIEEKENVIVNEKDTLMLSSSHARIT